VSAVAAPSDRRFRRALVKPARKGRRRWRAFAAPIVKYGALAAAIVYALYRASAVAAHAHALRVDRIVVRGNERISRDEVLAALSGLRGDNILLADLEQWRARLVASPWVRDAALRRSLPATVEVVVWERQPIGIGRINGDMFLVDERGIVIDRYGPQYADFDLPIIDGLAAARGNNAAMTDDARAELAARVIAELKARPAVAARLSQVDVSNAHDAAVILSGDPAVIQLGEDQFLQRLQAYLDLAPALHERVESIDHVDLRFDDRIYVRPAKADRKQRR
jgi:cell division septal protein FtsQ